MTPRFGDKNNNSFDDDDDDDDDDNDDKEKGCLVWFEVVINKTGKVAFQHQITCQDDDDDRQQGVGYPQQNEWTSQTNEW